jgi:hypothetical protein
VCVFFFFFFFFEMFSKARLTLLGRSEPVQYYSVCLNITFHLIDDLQCTILSRTKLSNIKYTVICGSSANPSREMGLGRSINFLTFHKNLWSNSGLRTTEQKNEREVAGQTRRRAKKCDCCMLCIASRNKYTKEHHFALETS